MTVLDGRKALVTGASRGIGAACATALAAAGAHVAVAARDEDRLRGLVDQLGSAAMALPTDLQEAGAAAALVARAAFMISTQPRGAILAIIDDPDDLDGIVSPKDRYDLRNEIDPRAMRVETRLHHLIEAADLDEETLVRLAGLDGATVVDRDGNLIAYGAIVTSSDSQHEGARTAAAKTLSLTALVVLKVSVDGDITVFREGRAVSTLLGTGRGAP